MKGKKIIIDIYSKKTFDNTPEDNYDKFCFHTGDTLVIIVGEDYWDGITIKAIGCKVKTSMDSIKEIIGPIIQYIIDEKIDVKTKDEEGVIEIRYEDCYIIFKDTDGKYGEYIMEQYKSVCNNTHRNFVKLDIDKIFPIIKCIENNKIWVTDKFNWRDTRDITKQDCYYQYEGDFEDMIVRFMEFHENKTIRVIRYDSYYRDFFMAIEGCIEIKIFYFFRINNTFIEDMYDRFEKQE